jgi:hypothetical protein
VIWPVLYLMSLAALVVGFMVAPGHTLRGPYAALLLGSNIASGMVLALGALA